MIVVIGGGPAGRYAAMRLAGAGREVRLIERRREGLGGQCLHQGCMVICALNDVARTMEHLEMLHRSGIITSVPKIAYPALISRMQEIIKTITQVIDEETRTAGVSVIQGDAQVEGRSVLINAERLEPEAIIIATGTRPRRLHVPGEELPGVMTAHTIFSLPTLPSRLVIIGGGVIAAEMAYLFSLFGSAVTILSRSTLLKEFPATLVKEATKELHRVTVLEHTRVIRITGETRVSGVEVHTSDGLRTLEADAILIAAGTEPENSAIQGIPFGQDGFIKVNDRMETGIPGVYAVGDVTGSSHLTPVARWQGRAAADAILGLKPAFPLDTVPQAIKLRNDLAFCGVQDEGGMKVTIPSPAGPGSFWAIPDRATGRASMTADPDSGRILGMLEASPYASVIAAYHALLINTHASIDQMERFIEVHPSADGTGWIGRYLAEKIIERNQNTIESIKN
ncbi:MAG: NAD(P)/FAD-dependent oxidoreductase [Methanospirillum sp.]|uniref:NAD(P)/FAD-dependent oxidoreductase n=1 Tax=Methanospirillum sp. TaxID=45200 RepID=UPI002369550B|nr:NAD(P)/FAD-dependent oxidoreductase [Methanospirillum sp.]MDD1728980.1 NAD(P)/FAD-dependent oxidoreductase [Methanospirillum sp.]